jgi:hypothetical protein
MTDELTTEFVDAYLEHFGTKGMRWGIRNDGQAGSSRGPAHKSWNYAPPGTKAPSDGSKYTGPRYNRANGTKIGISARDFSPVKRGERRGLTPNNDAFLSGLENQKTLFKRYQDFVVRSDLSRRILARGSQNVYARRGRDMSGQTVGKYKSLTLAQARAAKAAEATGQPANISGRQNKFEKGLALLDLVPQEQ